MRTVRGRRGSGSTGPRVILSPLDTAVCRAAIHAAFSSQNFRLEFVANSEMVLAYEKSGSARFVSARTATPVNVVYSNETELPK